MRYFLLTFLSASVATGAFANAAAQTSQPSDTARQALVEEQAARILAYRQVIGPHQMAAPEGLKEMPVYVESEAKTPAPTTTGLTHSVVKGDTLFSISKRYGVDIEALKLANAIQGSSIQLGQMLIIPPSQEASLTTTKRIVEPVTPSDEVLSISAPEKPKAYAVVRKDTLFAIAQRTCTSTETLIELNALEAPGQLTPGQMLKLPENHCLER